MKRIKFRIGYKYISIILGFIEDYKLYIYTSNIFLAWTRLTIPKYHTQIEYDGEWLYIGNNYSQDNCTYLDTILNLGIEVFKDEDYGISQNFEIPNLSAYNRDRIDKYLNGNRQINKILLYTG